MRKKKSKIKGSKEYGLGMAPHFYSEYPRGSFNKKVYVNEYELVTGDWFECGHPAYSLHLTERNAERYDPNCPEWGITRRAEIAYVTEQTLEKLVRAKRVIFVSMEP